MTRPDHFDTNQAAHRALCVYATEQRLFALNAGDAMALRCSLPGPDSAGQKWVAFVGRCAVDGIDPASYIRRVFAMRPPDMAPPADYEITRCHKVASHHDSLGRNITLELTTTLQSQYQLIDRHVKLGKATGETGPAVLMRIAADPFLPLHPVIRLKLAEPTQIRIAWSLTNPLVAEAVLTYGRTPDLFDQAWGPEWVHPTLQQRGQRDYSRLLRLEG